MDYLLSNSTGLAVGAVVFSLAYIAWMQFTRFLENKLPFDGAVPALPNSHWFLGHIAHFRGKTIDESLRFVAMNYANKYGQTSWWVLRRQSLSVTDIDDAKLILQTSHMQRPIWLFRHHMEQWLGRRSIGMLRGKEWKFHRSSILRAFSPSVTEASKPDITRVVDTFIRSIRKRNMGPEEAEFEFENIEPFMKMITMDIFGSTSLSKDLRCCELLEPSPVARAFDITGLSLRTRFYAPLVPWKQLYWIPTRENFEYKRQRAILRGFIENTVDERRKLLASKTTNPVKPPNDLLTSLLKAAEETSNGDDDLSTQTFRDILMSLLFAGYDTTSVAMTYALYHVASHVTVEDECLKEIKRFWRGPMTNVEDLVYCKAVILESLRLFPPAPAPALSRSILKETKLKGGFVVPEGTSVYIPVYAIQRMGTYYPKPDEFLPERWAYKHMDDTWVERSEGSTDRTGDIHAARRDAFLAFSTGARSCAGQRFALNEAILILAGLLKDIKFIVKDGYIPVAVRVGVVQRPRDGMPMKLVMRN